MSSDKKNYISLSQVVKDYLAKGKDNTSYWYEMPKSAETEIEITEDVDFEIIEPKQLTQ